VGDLDGGGFVEEEVTVGGPRPVFGSFDEASGDGVAVHVLDLFDSLVVGEDVEVVVAGLPEGCRGEALGDGEFQGLEGFGEWVFGRLAEEQVDVLGHDDVAEDFEVIAFAGEFEGVLEDVSGCGGVEVGFAVVTTEGDEVVVALLLVSLEVERHGWVLVYRDFRCRENCPPYRR
jgi:hypothetical protein